MIISGEDEIIRYIPQRSPMVMVSGLYSADEKSAHTSFLIEPENIFVEDAIFCEPGIIEHIAQSTALHAGYGFIKSGKPIPVGYIAAVKDLFIHYLPNVGDELDTHIEIVNQVMNVVIVSAKVKSKEKTIATCEMRVFIKE